jgi:hypothetical protein
MEPLEQNARRNPDGKRFENGGGRPRRSVNSIIDVW